MQAPDWRKFIVVSGPGGNLYELTFRDVGAYQASMTIWNRYDPFHSAAMFLLCFSVDIPDSLNQIVNGIYFPEAHVVKPSAPVILLGLRSDFYVTGTPSEGKARGPIHQLILRSEIEDAGSKMGVHAIIQIGNTTDVQDLITLISHIFDEYPPAEEPPKGILSRLLGKKPTKPKGSLICAALPPDKPSETYSTTMEIKQLFGGTTGVPAFTSYGQTCAVHRHYILFFGGIGLDQQYKQSPQVLDLSHSTPRWQLPLSDSIPSEHLPAPERSPPSTPIEASHSHSSCLELSNGSRTVIGTFPATCSGIDGTLIYVFGGSLVSGLSNRLLAFNVERHLWITLLDEDNSELAPFPSYGSSLVQIENHLYLFGGCTTEGPCSQFFEFSLESNTWHSIGSSDSAPPPRYHHNTFVDGRTMYVYGGLGAKNVKLSDLWAIEPYTGDSSPSKNTLTEGTEFHQAKWRKMITLGSVQPTPQRGHVGCFWRTINCFILVGSSNQNPLCEIFSLDLRNFMWTKISCLHLPAAREFHSVIPTTEGSLLIACGMWRRQDGGLLGDGYLLSQIQPLVTRIPNPVWIMVLSFLGPADLCRLAHVSFHYSSFFKSFYVTLLPMQRSAGISVTSVELMKCGGTTFPNLKGSTKPEDKIFEGTITLDKPNSHCFEV
ncbi:hypothetical protein Pelo_8378 [Pelomyxa schiedti]|nr:hypothetical protein Pelo_8378 [Pelomyxa schiedti]